ncbi:MAG: LAGLIDADG family homing endonuclease [Patescibacteria group bacterium]
MSKRGRKPLGKTSTRWTPELAYAVGLLATDGNLSKDERHMDFTSKDKSLVITFQNCLGLENKIGKKSSGYTNQKDYFHSQFGDVLFYRWLLGLGLKPNKSKTLGRLKIPDRYFFDFFRGCFDGDGSVYAYWDPRWHSSYMFYLTIASSSPAFLKYLQDSLENLVGIQGKISAGGRGSLHLRFAKKDTQILVKKMYYADSVPKLERKFTKIEKIFRINQSHNIGDKP